ncbi:hypothetical protein K438DRAFT_2129327 [Mycena galopus ATCC 62051]|nr:hypothetical protein K438DRAFT_2129327 [Mycena galopus ATCC 62051]
MASIRPSLSSSNSGSTLSVHSIANTVTSTAPLTAAYRPPPKDFAAAFGNLQAQYGMGGGGEFLSSSVATALPKKKQRKTPPTQASTSHGQPSSQSSGPTSPVRAHNADAHDNSRVYSSPDHPTAAGNMSKESTATDNDFAPLEGAPPREKSSGVSKLKKILGIAPKRRYRLIFQYGSDRARDLLMNLTYNGKKHVKILNNGSDGDLQIATLSHGLGRCIGYAYVTQFSLRAWTTTSLSMPTAWAKIRFWHMERLLRGCGRLGTDGTCRNEESAVGNSLVFDESRCSAWVHLLFQFGTAQAILLLILFTWRINRMFGEYLPYLTHPPMRSACAPIKAAACGLRPWVGRSVGVNILTPRAANPSIIGVFVENEIQNENFLRSAKLFTSISGCHQNGCIF